MLHILFVRSLFETLIENDLLAKALDLSGIHGHILVEDTSVDLNTELIRMALLLFVAEARLPIGSAATAGVALVPSAAGCLRCRCPVGGLHGLRLLVLLWLLLLLYAQFILEQGVELHVDL